MKQDRQSNIELLRVISMLLIVIYHFCIHAVADSVQNPHMLKAAITVLHIGVICFVLISGYWGIKPSFKGFLKFYIQCSFYSLFIYLVYSCINPSSFNIKELIVAFFPIQWWFIKVYMCLYILSPIINIPLKTESAKSKILWIVSLGIIALIPISIGLDEDGKNVINFIFIYYIGNFLRNNIKISNSKLWRNRLILIYVFYNIFIVISILLTASYPKIQNHLFGLFFPYNSIGLILNAIIFFLIFTCIEVKSRIINWIALSILPVYFLHENKYFGEYLWGYILTLQNNIESPILFSLVLVLLAVITVFACVFLDKLLSPIYTKIETLLFKIPILQKIDVKVKNVLNQSEIKI